jgi:nucleoside-diphosphate kinase
MATFVLTELWYSLGDYCIEVGRNICHGSDAVESAEKEIALWFTPEELNEWTQASESWIYE